MPSVDVTDATQAPQGSLKKMTWTNVFAGAQPITQAGGTITVSTPAFQASQTWNAGGVTFTALDLNVTDTASASGSLLLNLRKAGTSQFKVDKSGNVTIISTGTLTYAGVTFNATVTGSGNLVGSASPTFTGTVTAAAIAASGAITASSASAHQLGPITFTNGAIAAATTLTLSTNANIGGTASANISGTGALTLGPSSGNAKRQIEFVNPAPTSTASLGGLIFYATSSTAVASLDVQTDGNTDAGTFIFNVVPHGAGGFAALRLASDGGLLVNTGAGAAPTGGSKGAGTLNVATGIYLNNTAYTNPGWVLDAWRGVPLTHSEKWWMTKRDAPIGYVGRMSLSETEAYAREHGELPLMHREWDGDLFARGSLMLASLEEAYTYLFDLRSRLDRAGIPT